MFRTLRGKLLSIYLGVILLGFGGLTVWAAVQLSNAAYSDFGQSVRTNTLQLANQLVDPLEDNLQRVTENMVTIAAESFGAQVAIFDTAGQSLLTSDGQPATLVTQEAYTYQDNVRGELTVYSAEPVLYEGTTLAIVQLAIPASTPQASATQRIAALVTAFLLISALGLVVTLGLVSTMTAPLTTLRETALSMADGNLSERVETIGRDEIGEVGLAFNTMAERVEAILREQRAFASNASHELRTPLTTVQLRTEALQNSLDDPELTTLYVNEIDSEIKRMGRLVDDLMLLSRLDAKRLDAGNEAIDVRRLMHILEREFRVQAAAKSQSLQFSMPDGELKPIMAHANHVRIVFGNLLGNAIKYTPEGGSVTCAVAQDGAQVRFQVADSGVGISAEFLPSIGKRFYRADKAHSRTTQGTGLGLALVQSILDLYGGRFVIESAGLGQGTTVTVWWPTASPDLTSI